MGMYSSSAIGLTPLLAMLPTPLAAMLPTPLAAMLPTPLAAMLLWSDVVLVGIVKANISADGAPKLKAKSRKGCDCYAQLSP